MKKTISDLRDCFSKFSPKLERVDEENVDEVEFPFGSEFMTLTRLQLAKLADGAILYRKGDYGVNDLFIRVSDD